jgi:hypothetical protein
MPGMCELSFSGVFETLDNGWLPPVGERDDPVFVRPADVVNVKINASTSNCEAAMQRNGVGLSGS